MAKNDTDYVKLALLVIVGGMFLSYAGVISIGGEEVKAPTDESEHITGKGSCSDDQMTDIEVTAVKSVLDSNDNEVEITSNADASIYRTEDTTSIVTINAGSGYQSADNVVVCDKTGDSEFKAIVGDANSQNYYHTQKVDGQKWIKANAATKFLKFAVDEVGSFSVDADTATSMGQSSGSITKDLAADQVWTDLSLNIQENSGAVVRQPTVLIDYNTSAFSDITIPNAETVDTPTRLSGYEKAYKVSDKLVNYDKVSETVKVHTSDSLVTDANETVTMKVVDKGTYVQDGEIKTGLENEDYNDIGASDATYTFEID